MELHQRTRLETQVYRAGSNTESNCLQRLDQLEVYVSPGRDASYGGAPIAQARRVISVVRLHLLEVGRRAGPCADRDKVVACGTVCRKGLDGGQARRVPRVR